MLGRTDSRARLFSILLVVIVVSTAMAARLAYWQIDQQQNLSQVAAQGSIYTETIPPQRGTIYDRTGTIVLAQTVDMYRVIGDPHDLTDAQKASTTDALIDYLVSERRGRGQGPGRHGHRTPTTSCSRPTSTRTSSRR